jgi:hypothetical protein
MTDPKTRWDKIQAWFKNNPIGVIILLLLAIVGAIATGLESGSKILDKLRPPKSKLVVRDVLIQPLEQFPVLEELSPSNEEVFPYGARTSFELRHDAGGLEALTIFSLEIDVKHTPNAPCPFRVDGDRMFGAGKKPVEGFEVTLSGGRVERVRHQQKGAGSGGEPERVGRGVNLLDLTPPLPSINVAPPGTGENAQDYEKFAVEFRLNDSALYFITLSAIFSSLSESRDRAPILTVKLCRP